MHGYSHFFSSRSVCWKGTRSYWFTFSHKRRKDENEKWHFRLNKGWQSNKNWRILENWFNCEMYKCRQTFIQQSCGALHTCSHAVCISFMKHEHTNLLRWENLHWMTDNPTRQYTACLACIMRYPLFCLQGKKRQKTYEFALVSSLVLADSSAFFGLDKTSRSDLVSYRFPNYSPNWPSEHECKTDDLILRIQIQTEIEAMMTMKPYENTSQKKMASLYEKICSDNLLQTWWKKIVSP